MRGDKDLLMWMPLKDELQLADPLTSTYTSAYRADSETSCCDRDVTRQKYVPTLELVYTHRPHQTTYRYDIGQYNPLRTDPPTVRTHTPVHLLVTLSSSLLVIRHSAERYLLESQVGPQISTRSDF